jgi:hypothetical protein
MSDGPSTSGGDNFGPPAEPCECYCLHCGRVFMSDGIWFQKVIGSRDGFTGFWMCPTPNCDGAGFTFDIFPTDPEHPANVGWVDDDEEDDDEDEEGEWDPAESKYAEMDEEGCAPEDDLAGEEWKQGLQPGEEPAEPNWAEEARREWEEEQKKYDEPDRRPREVDWSDRPERPPGEDEIPY